MRFDYGYDEEQRLGKPYDLKLLRRIWPHTAAHRRKLLVSVLMVITITVLDLSIPYITKEIIDRYIVPRARITETTDAAGAKRQLFFVDLHDPDVAGVVYRHPSLFHAKGGQTAIFLEDLMRLDQAAIKTLRRRDLSGLAGTSTLFLLVVVAIFGFTFAQNMIMELAGHRIMHDLRITLFAHIQNMPLSFFNRNPVARLVTRTTNDIQNMHELFTSVISMIFKDMFLLVGIAAVLLSMNWRLALLTFLVLPLVVMAAFGFSNRVRDVFRELRTRVAEINTRFSETISGIKVIQTFQRERENTKAFDRLNHANYLAGMRQINIFAVFMPVIEMLGVTTTAIVIWVGGGDVLENVMTIGTLAAFIAYLRMFFRPIRDLAEKYNILQNAMSSAERIFLLLDQSTNAPTDGEAALQGTVKRIRFDDVWLSYNSGEMVLKGIDLTVNAGETVAIVGATGSGKTSLVNLLVRFYTPTRGMVRVNGVDAGTIPPADLRKRIALVMQDPFLFSGTLADNLFFAAGNLSQAQKKAILQASRCHHMVSRFPDGLETLIMEGGASLSSGERQLISVARAFAADPEVIILDEATSYVDSHTEIELQAAIANLMKGRTSLVVAHRLTTARTADRIVVLSGGRMVETGDHAQLMSIGGYYYRLYRLQTGKQ